MLLEMPGEVIPASQVKDVARNINVDSEDLLGFVGQLFEMSKFEGITPHFTFIEVNLTELIASYRREIMIIAKPEITVRVKTNLSPHCKAIVEMLGGEFYIETEDGRKTIATFWFPCEMRDRYKDI